MNGCIAGIQEVECAAPEFVSTPGLWSQNQNDDWANPPHQPI